MISILFIRIKPTTLAAIPEKEFKSEITTGISPPPMGSTNKAPKIRESATKVRKTSHRGGIEKEIDTTP
jgi:hypothetical protein